MRFLPARAVLTRARIRAGWRTSAAIALLAIGVVPSTGASYTDGGAQAVALPSVDEWPDADTTGVPDGTELEIYTGPTTITQDGTEIDAMVVDDDLRIMADDVVITRSIIRGGVSVREPTDGSFHISDSEIRIQGHLDTGLDRHNFVAERVEISGGRRSVYCSSNCTIENSWVHGQAFDPKGKTHMSGIRMGQDTIIRHNTITCDGARMPPASGCSAGLTGYGNFAPVRNNLIEANLFLGGTSTMCAYGGSSDNNKPYSEETRDVRFIDNVFVRGFSGTCGERAAIASFDEDAPGNIWRNNRWDDGTILRP